MSVSNVPFLDLRLDPKSSDKATLSPLLQLLRPSWKIEDVSIQLLPGGNTNTTWLCHSHTDSGDKLIVRINPDQELPAMNRCLEVKVTEMLAAEGIAPPLYARFKNGIVSKYVEGVSGIEQLNYSKINEEHMRKLILKTTIAFHQHSVEELDLSDDIRQTIWYRYLAENVHNLKDKYSDQQVQAMFDEGLRNIDNLRQHAKFTKELMESLWTKYPLTLCHNDSWSGNLIYVEEKDHLYVIDWEFCSAGIPHIDMSALAIDMVGPLNEEGTLNDEQIRNWATDYLKMSPRYADEDITDALIEQWVKDIFRITAVLLLANTIFFMWLIEDTENSVAKDQERMGIACMVYNKFVIMRRRIESWEDKQ